MQQLFTTPCLHIGVVVLKESDESHASCVIELVNTTFRPNRWNCKTPCEFAAGTSCVPLGRMDGSSLQWKELRCYGLSLLGRRCELIAC
ncbi:hypothetical protein V6N13_042796 [Hibiscus sabdariffa]|uniref:Uncharacterized protein n=1 Tax=Hibiscus sabdariffa TaxID=183260 RepID=A0ABR2G3L2_9ROSI